MIRFAIVGSGWRAQFFLRIAALLPERFEVTGVSTRTVETGAPLTEAFGVPTVRLPDELLAGKPEFVVLSVPWPVTPELIVHFAGKGVPVLAETPPAPNLDALLALNARVPAGAKVQVAEQYPFQPLHAARLAIAGSGKLGAVAQAQVSAAHGYHGMVLIRRLLGVGFEEAKIVARRFVSSLVAGPDRNGPPAEEKLVHSAQTLAWIEFNGEKLGVFDFTGDQYFSWVRGPRVLVRGARGEIVNETVRWLIDHRTPAEADLIRRDTGHGGNLDGYHHEGYLLSGEWVYQNPFAPGRLADDEIAIATVLQKMAEYVAGGPGVYGLAEASQDHYLGIVMDRAATTGEAQAATRQAWAG